MTAVEKATSWEQVEKAALSHNSCISPPRGNWEKAKETWEKFHESDQIIYYLLKNSPYATEYIGYVRLLRISIDGFHPTYVADFVSPSHYAIVALAAQKEPNATILVKSFQAEDDWVKSNWARVSFPIDLSIYPYSVGKVCSGTWLVVN